MKLPKNGVLQQAVNYFLPPTDVTEGGQNDAIIFDFAKLTGEIQPSWLRAIVRDNTNSIFTYEIRLSPLVPNDSPHSLVMPFDAFTFRGGSPGLPDPTTLKEIHFDFYFLGHHGELNWSAEIERIRFASIIPEPMTNQLVCFATVAAILVVSRGRKTMVLASIILAAVGMLATTSDAQAEIILDDFNEPFEIDLPLTATSSTIVQSGIGALSAERRITFVNSYARPTGYVDANGSHLSALTIALDRLHPTSSAAPVVSLNLSYSFDGFDITQGGVNNRVAIDFAYLESTIALPRIDVFVNGRGLGHGGHVFHVPTQNHPFSVEIPFDMATFAVTPAHTLLVSIMPAYFTPVDEVNFTAVIDRIRFTNAIPEPTAATLVGVAAAVAALFRRWRLLPTRMTTSLMTVSVLLTPLSARAEVVIDDFVDDLRINLPEENGIRFRSWDIGDLGIFRAVSVTGIQTQPNGYLDVNQSQSSALTVGIPTISHWGGSPGASVSLVYGLAPPFGGMDLSQGGQNNAVILDFDRLTADIPLHRVYVLATHGAIGSSYISTYSPIPQSPSPFSLTFPFDEFQPARGTSLPNFDFSFIRELHVLIELAMLDPNMPEQLGFEMVLKKLRVGHMVPEPFTIADVGLMLTMLCIASHRRFRFSWINERRSGKEGVGPCENTCRSHQLF